MIESLTQLILRIMDALIGWLLAMPMDVALVVVALGTSAVLTFIRPWTTNQDLLHRIRDDRKVLKRRLKSAKRAKDKDETARVRAVQARLAMLAMKQEGKPLLVALVPVAMLAVWALARLGYHAPMPGAPVTLRVEYPVASVGDVVHVVPQDGLTAESGWIQRIVECPPAKKEGTPTGVATWTIKAARRETPYRVEIRHAGETAVVELLVDGRRYAPAVQSPGGDTLAAQQMLAPYHPFGFIPGIPWIAFDPWLVGYLVLTVPFVFGLRALFKIC